ncbi:hypothetical protein [Flammeovirga aprica]|uniref:Uncharacterized protein n=1 Tax=Flammeovirga aprica JL-4 TaxID=694437 RepID=A0A7X9RW45_9BACT|nr:hypothetical protein [Flammeovirga aprica]NME69813.1 hypothetical protein [Flammeovirga aprica JL-4]
MNILIKKTVLSKLKDTCRISFEFFMLKDEKAWLQPLYKTENYVCLDQESERHLEKSAQLFSNFLSKVSDQVRSMTEEEFYVLFESMSSISSEKEFMETLQDVRTSNRVA